MKAVKLIAKIFVILALIAMIAVIIFVQAPSNNAELLIEATTMPELENKNFTFISSESIPSDNTQLIALAAQAYETANINVQNYQVYATAVKYSSTVHVNLGIADLDVPVQGYRYTLRNGNEYYSTEYAIPGKGGIGMLAGMFAKENSDFASRSYANLDLADYMYSEKCYSPKIVSDPETGEIKIQSDFTEKNAVPESKWAKKQPVPYFSDDQEQPYYAINRALTKDVISKSTIEYFKSTGGNFYRVTIEADVSNPNAGGRALEELRASTSKDAHYTQMLEIFDIWENGYFKSYRSYDNSAWNGDSMSMSFDYECVYYYDEDHTKPSYYQNFDEVKLLAVEYMKNN